MLEREQRDAYMEFQRLEEQMQNASGQINEMQSDLNDCLQRILSVTSVEHYEEQFRLWEGKLQEYKAFVFILV